MFRITALVTALGLGYLGFAVAAAQERQGTAERIGEQIDRGLSQLGAELSEAWSDVRRGVERMGVQGRVFGRLHWDKSLQGAKLDIAVKNTSTVVLTGSVPSDEAKTKAEELTTSTIGVSNVVNELVVSQRQASGAEPETRR
jgi:hypothetical protein